MKIKLFLACLCLFAVTNCSSEMNARGADVPPDVQNKFNELYPTAEKVNWDIQKDHGDVIYEADFKVNGDHKEAHFKPDGTMIRED